MVKSDYEYKKVEYPFIETLLSYGWVHKTGADLKGERKSQADVLLEKRFRQALKRLNPWLSDGNLNRLVRQFTTPVGENLWSINKEIYNWLFGDGVTVEQDLGSGKKGQ